TTEEFLNFCKQKDLTILVTSAVGEKLVHELGLLHEPLAIVLGSEKSGCSQAVMAAATLNIRIPMNSQVESLNVSAAAGIILYNRLGFNQITCQSRSGQKHMESHYEPDVYSKATL
ncbi:MAG: TrmH family RNA methyltransferase, partial [Chloroflexota bacterium]